jgi:PAS domain S-box-containing protein
MTDCLSYVGPNVVTGRHLRPVPYVTVGKVPRLEGTDRGTVQAALEQSEARFRALSEASFDGIIVTIDGIIREANRGVADMLGYGVDELVGRPGVDLAAEESRETVGRRIADGAEGRYEALLRHRDGRRLVVELTASEQQCGGHRERLTALRDVTARRALEDRLRQAQKMEAVGRLAGGVAHDFNNLLTVITSYTSLLLDDAGTTDAARADLQEILRAAMSAAGLSRQLQAFSRQQVIEPKVLVLEPAVAASAKLLQRVLGENIVLNVSLSEETSTIRIDPAQLDQVLMNLVVNARDAMPTGGKLSIRTGTTELCGAPASLDSRSVPARFAVLTVSDTGIGMDEQTQGRIFEPFFTTKEPGHGTGLGLATVYGIVKQSEGSICVSSEPGQGTTFRIYLPLADGAAIGSTAGVRPGAKSAALDLFTVPLRSADQVSATSARP